MSIGVIPVAELLAYIGRVPLCPHHLVLVVATASSNGYSLLFPYRKHTGMFMRIFFPTVS
jgi:hypothetical protein